LGDKPGWSETITGLRIDPAANGNSDESRDDIAFDYIKAINFTGLVENSLAKTIGTYAVYLFKDNRKWGIVNEDIFNRLSYEWGNIIDYSLGILDQYSNGPNIVSEGSLIREEGTYGVYLIENGERKHITYDAFIHGNYQWEDVYDVPKEGWNNLITLFPLGNQIVWDTISPSVSIIVPSGGEAWVSGDQQNIRWISQDNVEVDYINLYYTIDGWQTSNNIISNLSNTDSYLWTIPAINTTNAGIQVMAYDKSGNVRSDYSGAFIIASEIIEMPGAPYLYGLGTMSTSNQVSLSWKKVVDSQYNDNVSYYEIEYADNNNFTNAIGINVGNIVTYTVTGFR